VVFIASAAAYATLAAANFWDEKPFQKWSDAEVERMLSDSPWARQVSVALPPRLIESGGFGPQGRGGSDNVGNLGPMPMRVRVTISWRSALPVKQALVRGQAGLNGEVSAENNEFLTRDERFYVLGVTNVPMPFRRTPLEAIKADSFLRRDRKPAIPADDVTFQQGGSVLLIAFPRSDDLAVDDRQVEFVTKLGDFSIKWKFRLKDMVFQGKLEL
jgi:hypothetical protein